MRKDHAPLMTFNITIIWCSAPTKDKLLRVFIVLASEIPQNPLRPVTTRFGDGS